MQDNNQNEIHDQNQVAQEQLSNDAQYDNGYEQQNYDQYYGGTSMQYNADQISSYENAYDTNTYQDYYNSYYQTNNSVLDDKRQHQELYEYYLANLDLMKSSFPKKRKIVRWEDESENYNSLEASEEFMDILGQMQEAAQQEQEVSKKQQREFEDILENNTNI